MNTENSSYENQLVYASRAHGSTAASLHLSTGENVASNDHGSEANTELDVPPSATYHSLGAFSSTYTFHTPATSPESSFAQPTPKESLPLTPSLSITHLRRSISVDRVTIRTTKDIAPPLNRTYSDGLNTVPATRSILKTLPFKTPGSHVTVNDRSTNINTLLNAFCGDHAYLSQSDGPIYASDGENKVIEHIGAPGSRFLTDDEQTRYTTTDKGKGKAVEDPRPGDDSDTAYMSATSDPEPSPNNRTRLSGMPSSSSKTPNERAHYEAVPEYISDSEDIDISAYISTTASMPPFPAPTVSRSRSSSRSHPPPILTANVPPVPPLPSFARTRALSSPRLASLSNDTHTLVPSQGTPQMTPTEPPSSTIAPTSSSASISSVTSLSSPLVNTHLKPSVPPSSINTRQRSVSESGNGNASGSGSGSGSRGRLHKLTQAFRKSPNVSPGPSRGIEHIKLPSSGKHRPKYTIAFVGSSGCGKTSIIEKGSKSANGKFRQETTTRNVYYEKQDLKLEIRDVATVIDKSRNTAPMTTIEVDSAPLLEALDRGAEIWPESLPTIDGVVLCYDASPEGNQSGSFGGIQRLTDAFVTRRYPIIWVGCKSDWIRRPKKDDGEPTSPRVLPEGIIPPQQVFIKASEAHTGLIEVSKLSSYGKEQFRNLFTWMYKSAARLRREQQQAAPGQECLNHASPEVLDRKRSQRSHALPSQEQDPSAAAPVPPSVSPASPQSPLSPVSLHPQPRPVTRARSMSDLLNQEARNRISETSAAVTRRAGQTIAATKLARNNEEQTDTERVSQGDSRSSENAVDVVILPAKFRPDPFAHMTLDNMIVRLSGGMVPGYGDLAPLDILFNKHFMLTFRRFATPRDVLVAMIRRLRSTMQVEEMRRAVLVLFDYLLEWIYAYPEDFAAPGAIPPFETLVRLFREFRHEGAPRLGERIPYLLTLSDNATDWAKVDTQFTDGTDSDAEGTESVGHTRASPIASIKVSVRTSVAVTPVPEAGPSISVPRPKAFFLRRNAAEPSKYAMPEKDEKELRRLAKLMLDQNAEQVAEEITREDISIFLDLKPRDWLRHGYTTRGDRDPEAHPLDRASYRFERIGLLVASFILVMNRQWQRARAFEFWMRVASHLRSYNNFAALHTVVAALDQVHSGSEGAEIEQFIHAGDINWNKFLSMRVLILKSNGGAYKTALKHTSMPVIPTMAIHTSDIVRVMSNRDYKEGHPELIHWGKFQIIARIAFEMVNLQDRLHQTDAFDFVPHPDIARIFREAKPMSEELITELTYPPPEDPPPPKPGSVWSTRVMRKVLK